MAMSPDPPRALHGSDSARLIYDIVDVGGYSFVLIREVLIRQETDECSCVHSIAMQDEVGGMCVLQKKVTVILFHVKLLSVNHSLLCCVAAVGLVVGTH